jgi:hypothetical protein
MNSYSWNNGKTTSSIYAKNTGWYKVVVTPVTGCLSYDSIFVSILKADIVQNDTLICQGDSIALNIINYNNQVYVQEKINSLINTGKWTLMKSFNGHFYLKYNIRMVWPQAKLLCEQNGGYLYCVNSKLENDSVSAFIANSQLYGDFLLGLYQDTFDPSYLEPAGGWKWLDGTNMNYSNWGTNEPSGNYENFGIMDWNNIGEYWNDTYDNISGTVIMELTSDLSYLWNNGNTSSTITVSPTQSAKYWVKVSNGISTCTDTATITVLNSISPIIINNNGILSIIGGPYSSYQWNFEGMPIQGETNDTLKPNLNGIYSVTVTSGSCILNSQTYTIINVGITNTKSFLNGLKIYPNPTNSIINIEGLTKNENNTIQIFDVQGKLVITKTITEKGTIDLSELNKGVYVIKIGEIAQRIVKM